MAVSVIGRIELDIEGEHVVVGPFTLADREAVMALDGMGALELFMAHIEKPADFAERFGMPWAAAALVAWQVAVEDLMARLTASANRAARRHQN
jgi:hypothetical protein